MAGHFAEQNGFRFAGRYVGGVIVGGVFALTMDYSWGPWVVLAAVLSVLGQLGDFVESGLKRSFDVKDSGALLPGHGGVLDRFDSLIFHRSSCLLWYNDVGILIFV